MRIHRIDPTMITLLLLDIGHIPDRAIAPEE
jgi:hypothetical protein